mgnify:CR=1 FL=1|tara:strand:- start:2001 stop:3221 length:1221 start_codon:yes stop_codon:yes gene_type:complete
MKNKIINVGFVINYRLDGWLGVTYYYKNLFKTILDQENSQIKIFIITDFHMSEDEKNEFKGIKIIQTNLVNRRSRFYRLMNIFSILLFGKNFLLEAFLIKNNIDIISHTNSLGCRSKVPSIKWIPDFQEIHFPGNFSKKLKLIRRLGVYFAEKHSTRILLSAETVRNDLKKINTKAAKKSSVLYYYTNLDSNTPFLGKERLIEKYAINKNYFYVPNHFWKHKNHLCIYKAVKKLKNKNISINIVTTGERNDYRSPGYNTFLDNYVTKNNLEDNIQHLGIIPMNDVYALVKSSIAVINASFFEGWGTTVEHARFFNKEVIVSSLDIHLEQYNHHKSQKIHQEHNKKKCFFFNPNKYEELSKIILKLNENKKNVVDTDNQDHFLNHKIVIKKFYENFLKIIKESTNLN